MLKGGLFRTVMESKFLNGCGVGMRVWWQARCHGIFGMRKVLAELVLFCCREFFLQLVSMARHSL